jgi:hypothetical protein
VALSPEELAWHRLGTYRDDLGEFRRLKSLLAPELSRCFSPAVHEGQRRPYGAVVARSDDPESLGTLQVIGDPDEVRAAADGVNAVAYIVKSQPVRLLRLKNQLSSQDDCWRLAHWLDGVVTRVDREGKIWIASPKAVTTVDDLNGWTRLPAPEISKVLRRLLPDVDFATLDGLVRLSYSYLSPNKIGSTLLLSLSEQQNGDYQTAGTPMADRGLNVQKSVDWPLIEHELRHSDGATVVHHNGLVLQRGVIIASTPMSQELIRVDGGTRHNSAARHTFDRPDLLAFVVSSDGPVTIFSDGVRASELVLQDSGLPWNPSGGEMWTEDVSCPTCHASLAARKVILYGFREREEGYCPVCNSQVAEVHGWTVEVGLVKDTETIKHLLRFRQLKSMQSKSTD